jgi:hypothetical protein
MSDNYYIHGGKEFAGVLASTFVWEAMFPDQMQKLIGGKLKDVLDFNTRSNDLTDYVDSVTLFGTVPRNITLDIRTFYFYRIVYGSPDEVKIFFDHFKVGPSK